jgi:cysteine synthase
VIPESTSYDRIHLLKAQGVEIIRTPNVRRASDESCFAVARRIASSMSNALLVDEVSKHYHSHFQCFNHPAFRRINHSRRVMFIV